jgi:hypothetical protein
MRWSLTYAAWQAGPVSTTNRIAVVALAGIAADSTLLWRTVSDRAIALTVGAIAAALAIRVVRGLPRSTEPAAIVLSLVALASLVALTIAGPGYSPRLIGALAVAAVLSLAGLSALGVGWIRERRASPGVIALTRSAEHGVAIAQQR